ncbi:bifunctional precorrin-2 dehydrogenase/sirohydrochlorin ferrochelatase [Clostridiaceae bacterium 35-E11]
MAKYYPIMLDICEKDCIVVGGGQVAERKVLSLLDAEANVIIISPRITEKLHKLHKEKKIHWINRYYQEGDLKEAYLVYVATNDGKINEQCLDEARQEEILINIVDKPAMCDFIVPASIKRGDLHITISTSGKSPMLSRKIREDLGRLFGEEYAVFLEGLGRLREKVLEEITDIDLRREIFKKIVYSDYLDKIQTKEIEDAYEEMLRQYKEMIKKNGNR